MGNARFSVSDWQSYQKTTSHKTQSQIFTQTAKHQIHEDLDPLNIKVRESVDSAANPRSTPIIIAVDETGSMGILAETIIKHGLGVIMKEIYDRKPITDPHIMLMATGDTKCDRAPLQATQFEADMALADQIEKFYLEGNGGGNGGESYPMVWYFAATKTSCDSQVKRGKKGYIFTIGDEPPHMVFDKGEFKKFLGDDVERSYTAKELLDMARQGWEVFHLIVNPGSFSTDRWKELLGERAITISDHTKLAEVIVSTIQVIEGADATSVANSWSGDTSVVVRDSIRSLTKGGAKADDDLVTL